MSCTPKETIKAFWGAMQTNDFAKASLLLAETYTLQYPQSGGTFCGREAFVRLNADYPAHGRWQFTVNRLFSEDAQVVSGVSVTDSVANARVITFSTVENGLIQAQLEFWPEPFEVPEWRRSWSTRD